MLRVILVDDEKPALNLLSRLIGERRDAQVIGAYTDASEMLKAVRELDLMPDLVFLDIEMPEMNGLELATRLLELHEDIEIVFVTAYRQYALEAFRVNALDYLLKPVDSVMLHLAIDRVMKRQRRSVPARKASAASRIVCFGGLEIYKEDQARPIRFPTAKAEELFAYLLANRNKSVSTWALCDSLWPEYTSEKSKHNLHTTVYRMKKTLQDQGVRVRLSSQRGFYRLECEEACDYISFEHEISHMAEPDSGNIEALTKAIQLYKGPLFGDRDYSWCEAERERMSRYFAGLSKKLAGWHSKKREYSQAIEVLLTMLSHIPFDGEAHEMLLRNFIGLQDRTAFFTHYKKMEKIFKEELGAEPPEELRQFYTDIR